MVDAIQIQRLYESRTFTFILCNEIIWGLKGERMDIREKIADLQHDQWVGWMKYLFSKCYFKDGCYCPDCGISIDRDLNASLNIRNIGINTVGHTGINACGDGSLEPSLKQEKECLEN